MNIWRRDAETPEGAAELPPAASPRQDWTRLALLGLAYFLANHVALFFPAAGKVLCAVWPAAGIGLGALLLLPRRLWPASLLAIFLAGASSNLLSGRPLVVSLGFMAANVLESLLCAWLMTRWCGERIRFDRVREVVALAVCAGLVNACTALAGAGVAVLASAHAPFQDLWFTWWVGDGLGLLLVAPLLVTWAGVQAPQPGQQRFRGMEAAAFLALWCAVSWLAFQPDTPQLPFHPRPYMLFALLAWGAMRFSPRVVAVLLALAAAFAMTSASVVHGPFLLGGDTPTERLLQAQIFLGNLALAGYLLTALLAERRQAEASLGISETYNRAIFERSSVAIGVGNPAGFFSDANPALEHLLGYGRGELVGVRWLDITHPEDREENTALIQGILSGQRDSYQMEKRYLNKDGLPLWVHLNVSCRRDAQGRVQFLIGVIEDISPRRAAEEARAEREELFQAMFENNQAVHLLVDPESAAIIDANSAAAAFYGYSREELRAMSVGQINTLPPEQLHGRISEARNQGALFRSSHRLKDGSLREVEMRTGSFKTGGRTLILSSVQDLTDQLSAEGALKDTEERLRMLIELINEGVVLTTPDSALKYVNPAFARLFGQEPAALVGRQYMDILTPECAAAHPARWEARRRGSREPYEARYLRQDGSTVLGWVTPFPMFSGEGQYQGSCAIIRDITQARAREEADRLRLIRRNATLRLNEMPSASRQELLDYALEQIQTLTASPLGYIYSYDDMRRRFHLHSWSAEAMVQCSVPDKQTIYDLDFTGVWGDAVRLRQPVLMNDFAAPDPRKKGLPEGHVPLTRFLTLPVIRAGRVVAVVAVGNKAAPYDEEDAAQLRLFTDGLWSVLERQEALAQLNTVSERFHLAVRAGRIGLWDWDLVSGVMHCDTFMETCLGLHHHDLATGTPEDWLYRVHGEDRPRVREALETAWATGERFEQSFRVQRPDGTLMHLDSLAVTYRGPQDEPLRMVGVVIDVTRQRQAEEALRKSEERFRDLFVDAPLPYQSLDEDGNLLLANTVWLQTLGYQREEVLGRNFSEFLHPDWAAHFQQNFPKFKDAGFITGVEFTMLRKDGSTLLASFNGRVSRDSEGRFIRTHCTFQDITERCQAEEALRQAKAEAEAAALAKAQFLANMSHEIRTPLGGVIGAAKLLSQSALNLDQRQLADMAVESGRALLEIVNDILDFSKIEAGRLDLTPAPFALRADLTAVAAPFRLLAGQRGLTLTLTIDPATPDALVGDHGRLDQVLRNLLGNAVKFTETGSVTLAVNHDPACSPAPGLACLRFTVRDTGVGIEPDFLPHIFESFSQADGSYGKRHGGTGLGLAISRSLVERMGGSLEVQSTLGAGSAFTFALCLPLAEQAPLAAETTSPYAASRTPQSRPLRVLLAEDNEIGRMLAERILKDAGHTAASVVNGLEVLDRLKQETFDLVLMDVQMPGLDGISATRSIRQGQAGAHNADIPIVALTAYAQREDRERFLAAGMDDYVPKPVDEDELLAAMRRALELRATRQTAFSQASGPGRTSAAAPGDPAAGCPRFDCGYLARSYGDRSDLLAEMLTVFQQTSLPEFGRGLRQALAAEDYEHAKRVAHKAIGTFGSVGAHRAVQLAHAAETAASTGDLEAFRQFMEALLAEMGELAEHLRLGRPWPDLRPAKPDRGAS